MTDRVLVDTSALYAVVAPSDVFHAEATSFYDILISRRAELYLTSYVLLETMSIVHRRLGFAVLKRLVDSLGSIAEVYWIGQAIHEEAWGRLSSRGGIGPSIVDWTTILVANKLGAPVFAFDRHLEAEGLVVLPRKA